MTQEDLLPYLGMQVKAMVCIGIKNASPVTGIIARASGDLSMIGIRTDNEWHLGTRIESIISVNGTINVRSSNGYLIADATTGIVIVCHADNPEDPECDLSDIHKFDIDEWKKYWNEDLHDSIDILNFGYWNKDGRYEEPANDWREEVKLMRAEKYI